MSKTGAIIVVCLLAGCSWSQNKGPLTVKTELTKDLKEISGLTATANNIWAITDKPHAVIYKLDFSGNIQQKVVVTNTDAQDVEAVTSDEGYLYIGDVGDNDGSRIERNIIKVSQHAIGSGKEVNVAGEQIRFTFPGEVVAESKKQNNYDCESIMSFKDSLYVFTKDREDKETRLYVLPKTPGTYTARFIDSFNAKGLVTDAAINAAGNELALTGYHGGHKHPFIILFNNFKNNDFFVGDHKKINLTNGDWDWQVEGITYDNKNNVYFACEGTKQVKATFYGIKRQDIFKLEKGEKKDKEEKEEKSGVTKKSHLKT